MELTGIKYVDMTTLAGVQQVQIKVMVAEANRVAIRALGINAFVGGNDFVGGIAARPRLRRRAQPRQRRAGRPRIPRPDQLRDLAVRHLPQQRPGHLRAGAGREPVPPRPRRAEPGRPQRRRGQLPGRRRVPDPHRAGRGRRLSGTSLSIEYKKFGVQLKFRPTVAGDGTIRLHVAPEVSELSNTGAIILQGFSIPGLLTRRAETTVELKSGQTFGMAGLISQSTQARSSRIPGLGDLPVLGAMFRSVRYRQGDTELVVLVTASLVEPLSLAKRPTVPGELPRAAQRLGGLRAGPHRGSRPRRGSRRPTPSSYRRRAQPPARPRRVGVV